MSLDCVFRRSLKVSQNTVCSAHSQVMIPEEIITSDQFITSN